MRDDYRIESSDGTILQSAGSDHPGFTGSVLIELFDAEGNLKMRVEKANLITDAGDAYYAAKAIAAIAPSNPAAPTAASGMKLGTGATAPAKNGAGAALTTYLAGSNAAFDATYPQTANLGAGLGVNGVYRSSWAAGVATGTITEAAIVNDAGVNATSTAGNTYQRITFTAVPKTATDTLQITWNAKFLGV